MIFDKVRCPVCKTSSYNKHCKSPQALWLVCKCKYSEKMAVVFHSRNLSHFLKPGG